MRPAGPLPCQPFGTLASTTARLQETNPHCCRCALPVEGVTLPGGGGGDRQLHSLTCPTAPGSRASTLQNPVSPRSGLNSRVCWTPKLHTTSMQGTASSTAHGTCLLRSQNLWRPAALQQKGVQLPQQWHCRNAYKPSNRNKLAPARCLLDGCCHGTRAIHGQQEAHWC
jgi:hypothetical protein